MKHNDCITSNTNASFTATLRTGHDAIPQHRSQDNQNNDQLQ